SAVMVTLRLPVCSVSWPGPWPRTSADGEYTRSSSNATRYDTPFAYCSSSTRDTAWTTTPVGTGVSEVSPLMITSRESLFDLATHCISQQRGLRATLRQHRFRHGPLTRRPDRQWEVRVVRKARNHMPVHMRHLVAKARQVHLHRFQNTPHRAFD